MSKFEFNAEVKGDNLHFGDVDDKWISVKDRPLIIGDKKSKYWICTNDGEQEFLAAVPFIDSVKPKETNWWIRHCVIEDGIGLCVVGDEDNESAGWEITDVTHWMPLPKPPKE